MCMTSQKLSNGMDHSLTLTSSPPTVEKMGVRNLTRRIVSNILGNWDDMILGPVSYLDCIIFCIFLAPQLIWNVGLFPTIKCVLEALPFVCALSSSSSHFVTWPVHLTKCGY